MEEHFKSYTELSREIKADADRLTAMLRYYGLADIYGFPHYPKDKRSRNKREGGYAGKRAYYTEQMDGTVTKACAKHWRAHPSKHYDTLKSEAKFMKSLDQGE